MLSSFITTGSGFVFWIFAAKYFLSEQVGLASAIISASWLITTFSLLGFDISLARFLSDEKDKKNLINSCLTISAFTALLLSIIFIFGLNIFAPSMSLLKENGFFLLIFLIFTTIIPITELQQYGVFIGFRITKYSFFQTLGALLKIVFIPFVVIFGTIGIYFSYGITFVFSLVIGIFLILKIYPQYIPIPEIKKDIVKSIYKYSLLNYFARTSENLPIFILPILVFNILGSKMNAYFFISWQIAMFFLVIPRWVSMSLLAECSYDLKTIKKNTRSSLLLILLILVFVIIGIFLFGRFILGFFGEEYAINGFDVLLILSLGGIPFSFNVVYATIKRIEKQIKTVSYIYGGITIIFLVLSFLLLQNIGLVGIGYAWLIANITFAFVSIPKIFDSI